MSNHFFNKIATEYKALTPTGKSMVILAILLVIGIIIRWDYISEEIFRGFRFFTND